MTKHDKKKYIYGIYKPLTQRGIVGIATGYGLDDRGSEFESRCGQELSLLHVVVPGALSPGVKRPGREVDHSPPASAEVKKMWTYTSTPPYAFMA
jgi:hypothetical protein